MSYSFIHIQLVCNVVLVEENTQPLMAGLHGLALDFYGMLKNTNASLCTWVLFGGFYQWIIEILSPLQPCPGFFIVGLWIEVHSPSWCLQMLCIS